MTVEDFLALDREKLDQQYEFRNGSTLESLELVTLGLTIPAQEIYEKVAFPPFDPFRGSRKRKTS